LGGGKRKGKWMRAFRRSANTKREHTYRGGGLNQPEEERKGKSQKERRRVGDGGAEGRTIMGVIDQKAQLANRWV